MAASTARRGIWIGLLVLVVLFIGIGVWFAFSARAAVNQMTVARDSLVAAREAVTKGQPEQARTFITAASNSASAAADRVNGPLWRAAAAVPVLGDTPQTAQAVATSLDQALIALQPLTGQLNLLDPSSLTQDGQIDVATIQEALPAMKDAEPGLREAVATVEAAPVDGVVWPQVKSAATQFTDELTGLQSTVSTVVRVGEIAAPMLGADSPQRYFVGVLNPNEARGTGGFLGTYAILTADDGKLTVDEVGSNTDLPNLDELPKGLSKGFEERYRDDPTLIGNMNLSPHFPDTAKIWLAAWEQKTGEKLDGAIAADVVALGDLVEASGQTVPLPNGTSLTGDQLADFAIVGIYEQFPTAAQTPERKAYQEAIATAAVEAAASAASPQAMAEGLGQGLADGRIVVWSADTEVEKKLVAAGVGGSLTVEDGHNVQFVVLNASGSKLDAFLQRSLTYEVGRCPDKNGDVTSTATVDLTNDLALGERPPEYMVSLARTGPTGPIHDVLAQFHLPHGSEVVDVRINGKTWSAFQFEEQGRPAAMIGVTLPPRERVQVEIVFSEPASDGPGTVVMQPLADEPKIEVADVECSEG